MHIRQFVIPVIIIAATTFALYLWVATRLLQDPAPPPQSAVPAIPEEPLPPADESAAPPAPVATVESGIESASAPAVGGRKQVEIFGRVLDRYANPIADALIAEERYYQRARSDADGRYRIVMELPRHRYPRLHFLRSGYAGRLVKLGAEALPDDRPYELDVTLEDAADTVSLPGWVGNEIGEGLEGARVELSVSQSAERDSYYLTAFTDGNGDFQFEGVRADQNYELSVSLAPDYPYYQEPGFMVTRNPARVEIRLRKLRLVDVDGMILNRDSAPVPGYEMYVSNLTTGSHNRKIVSDSSGFFTLRQYPLGEISLATRGPEFYKVTGLRITEDHYQNLQIRVDRGSHHLAGWVSDANGIGVEKAMVTLDREFRSGEIEHNSYRSQATDANGAFAFSELGGGEYRLTIYALGYQKRDLRYRLDAPSAEIFIALEPY